MGILGGGGGEIGNGYISLNDIGVLLLNFADLLNCSR